MRVEPEDSVAVERLARYILRPPFSLERMSWRGEGEVRYRRKSGHDGGSHPARDQVETIDPAELLARVIMHIPEPRRHLVRYYGAYSNVSRGRRKRLRAGHEDGPLGSVPRPQRTDDEQNRSPDAKALRRRWRQLIKRVYEVDPLVCPSCGGEMKIIAFILENGAVDAILSHLARRSQAKSVRGPPDTDCLEVAS